MHAYCASYARDHGPHAHASEPCNTITGATAQIRPSIYSRDVRAMTFVLFTIGVLAFYLGHIWGTAIAAALIERMARR